MARTYRYDDIDDDANLRGILKDGEGMHVPIWMMDSAQFSRPPRRYVRVVANIAGQ